VRRGGLHDFLAGFYQYWYGHGAFAGGGSHPAFCQLRRLFHHYHDDRGGHPDERQHAPFSVRAGRKESSMRKEKNSETISTLLGAGTSVEGTLEFRDTIRLDGQVRGKIISPSGTLIIGEKALVEAEVSVGTAIIKGTVNGRVEAHDRVEIYAPASINGDVVTPSISIDAGVVFNGQCAMLTKETPKTEKAPPAKEKTNK
jgi:cytoskeletal protein CcmA (bactofilin family)